MFRMLAALIAMGASFLAASVPAAAQQQPYDFTPPPGWTLTDRGNGVLGLTPPGSSTAEAAILIMPVEPLGSDFDAQAAQTRAKYEAAMNLRDPAMTPAQRGRSDAGEHLLAGGSYTMVQDGRASPLHVLFYARGANGAFGFALFLTGTAEHYAAHGPAAAAMFNSFRLRAGAAEIAASRLEAPQAQDPAQQPQAQPQVNVAGTENAINRQRLYNQCVQNCGSRLMLCNSGAAFRPGNPYLSTCSDQNRNCTTNCMIFK